MSTHGLAIFDLDYTLTTRGTWGRFVWMNVKTRPHIWLPLLINAGWVQWQYKRGRRPRVDVKKAMMRWCLVGMPKAALVARGRLFAKREVEKGLRPGALRAIKRHRDVGDRLMIASAAVDIIVEPIANLLDIPYYVATNMAWDVREDGSEVLSDGFSSKNCYGEEKLVRVRELISAAPELKNDHSPVTVYSDSHSDIDLMQFYDFGIAVHPSKKLGIASADLGFTIVDWSR